MKKKQKKLLLSNEPEIRTKQIAEFTQKYCEEHNDLMDRLADGPTTEDDE